MSKTISMNIVKNLFFTIFVFSASPFVSSQSLSDQFKENERKQDLDKMKREDSAFIKEEMLRRQGISPEQLKANGKILKCDFPDRLGDQFNDSNNEARRDIQNIRRKYVLIDGKIVDPKARTNESAESWAVAPKVVGTFVIENGILKPNFIALARFNWEVNTSTGDSYVAIVDLLFGATKVYKAKCEFAAYVPSN